jgi:MFS family permease
LTTTTPPYSPPAHILWVIVLAQFFCTSLWFAGNAILSIYLAEKGIERPTALADLTSAVQFGFIVGTLLFAIASLADRFAPALVFAICALLGAVANLGFVFPFEDFHFLLLARFLTGFFLAGIYPVGMKIAADYYDKKLGTSLGYLVGALVLGTALPHLLSGSIGYLDWRLVIYGTSCLAVIGGCSLWALVPNGPFRRPGKQVELTAFLSVFKKRDFRRPAFGYFGHMWELYAFWAFVPALLLRFAAVAGHPALSIPLWSFAIIATGGLACIIGGYLSVRYGTKKIATVALSGSLACCLLLPAVFALGNSALFLVFMLVWGGLVVADSPLFSTLVARSAPAARKGTALTIVNCLGFAITIISIQLLGSALLTFDAVWPFSLLGIGPVLGLWALSTK